MANALFANSSTVSQSSGVLLTSWSLLTTARPITPWLSFALSASTPLSALSFYPGQERLGYRANFMRCAQHCTGDLIAFCDQDDVWDKRKLGAVEGAIQASTLLLQHDFRVVDADLNALPGSLDTIGISASERWAPVLGLVQVFRRSLLDFWPLWTASVDQNNPSERMAHDQWVYFLASVLESVQLMREPLLSYRQHGSNTCGLSGHGMSHAHLRAAAVIGDMVRGRPSTRHAKRNLILEGLTRQLPAAESRAAILAGILRQTAITGQQQRLERELQVYTQLSSYYRDRLRSYRSESRYHLASSVLHAHPAYLARGARGLKDLLLDIALNA